MHKLSIVGVSGQAGSGKDTVANYLCEEYGFVKVALADPIKRFGYYVFHFSYDQLWGPSNQRNAVDKRYYRESAWNEAQARLEAFGKQYVTDVLGDDDPAAVSKAYSSLVHWFFWLRDDYNDNLSPRIMLQTLGTEWGREAINRDVWLNYLLRTSRTLLHEDGNTKQWVYDPLDGCVPAKENNYIHGIVASDIRFENEFKRIRSEGGVVIRVIRPDTDQDAATLGIEGHQSEAHDYSFDNFDFILNNEGTLKSLHQAVDTYMTAFKTTHH